MFVSSRLISAKKKLDKQTATTSERTYFALWGNWTPTFFDFKANRKQRSSLHESDRNHLWLNRTKIKSLTTREKVCLDLTRSVETFSRAQPGKCQDEQVVQTNFFSSGKSRSSHSNFRENFHNFCKQWKNQADILLNSQIQVDILLCTPNPSRLTPKNCTLVFPLPYFLLTHFISTETTEGKPQKLHARMQIPSLHADYESSAQFFDQLVARWKNMMGPELLRRVKVMDPKDGGKFCSAFCSKNSQRVCLLAFSVRKGLWKLC